MLSDGQTRELQILVQSFIGVGLSYAALAELVGHENAGQLRSPENLAAASRWVVPPVT